MLIRTGGAMKIHIIFISLVFISTALNAETYMERQLRQLDETADDIQDTLKQQDAELKTSRAEMKKAIVKVSRTKEDADILYKAVDRLVNAQAHVAYSEGWTKGAAAFSDSYFK